MSAPAWAADPIALTKFERNLVEIPRYADIERQMASATRDIIARVQSGAIEPEAAVRAFRSEMSQAQAKAFVAGRRAKGVIEWEISDAEAQMLAGRLNRQTEFFRSFAADARAGRGRMPYPQRASMYGESLWSIYSRGESVDWNDADPNTRHYWVLDPDAEHCLDCLARAKKSRENDGFSWLELVEIGWPGETTICMTRCRCHVRTVHKRAVEMDRIDRAEAAVSAPDGIRALEQLLGGPNLPLRVPAAGLPMVKIPKQAVLESLASAPSDDAVGRILPLIPKVLVSPASVLEIGSVRWFAKGPLRIAVQRNPASGIHELLTILAVGERR